VDGPDPVAEAGQLALEPLVAPALVLPRHLLDQGHQPGIDWRPSCPGLIGPPPADQTPVPAQQRVRRDQPAPPQRPGQQPGQGGEHRAVGPSTASAWGSAAAAPRPRGGAPAARRPSKPPSVPAAPSSRSSGRTSGRASVLSRACDAASPPARAAGESTGQRLMHRFGIPHAGCRSSRCSRPPRLAAGAARCLAGARRAGPGSGWAQRHRACASWRPRSAARGRTLPATRPRPP
jgi:hypothetical protein